MASIAVFGATGYAGEQLVRVAAERGHTVHGYARRLPEVLVSGVEYHVGSIEDEAVAEGAAAGNDVVLVAVSPRGDMAGKVAPAIGRLAAFADQEQARLGVIGGAGSLQVTAGGPALTETPEFPEAFQAEAAEMAGVLAGLTDSTESLDWFFVSPAAEFGAHSPGERRGAYRTGGDVLLVDDEGSSAVSSEDLADAVIDEVEHPRHRRQRFTVAY